MLTSLQPGGTFSSSQINLHEMVKHVGGGSMSALRASAGISSGPSALPPLRALMAFFISVLVGGLQFISNRFAAGGISAVI